MNARIFSAAVGLTGITLSSVAQIVPDVVETVEPPARTVVERGSHHRIWQRDNFIQLADGRTTNLPVRLIEMATGLHYWENGEWKESRDEIEIVPDGAAATKGAHKVHFNANANTIGAVNITTPDGKTLRAHLLGLAYRDTANDQSVMFAALRDSSGWLFPPNQVLYLNAFSGVLADVRYTYTRAGFEQDVILRETPPAPVDYGFNAETTVLEVWTEFDEAPEPVKETRMLDGLTDESLNFGVMGIGRGSVFALDAPLSRMSGAPVGKRWIKDGNRTFLVEAVRYKSIESEVLQLPPRQAAIAPASKDSQLALLRKTSVPGTDVSKPVQLALDTRALDRGKGLVLDYVLYASDTNGVTFQADTTYLISGYISFNGDVTFEGNSVIKFTPTNYAIVQVNGYVNFKTDHYRPVIFTSRQDRTVGEDVYLAGAPTNYFQALTCNQVNQEFKHLRISYADYGLHTYAMKLRHAQFTHCTYALYTELTGSYGGSGAEVDNVLIYDVTTAFGGGGYTTAARHVTVDRCANLTSDWYGGSSIGFTNCLFVNVTNAGPATTNTASSVATDDSVFQVVGAGAHYLRTNSALHGAGTTAIPSWLATDLRVRTTYPPVVVTNEMISTNRILAVTVPRNSSPPDIGYAYAPLDYVYGSNVLTNATLTIFAGVGLGTFTLGTNIEASAPTAALWLHNNARVVTRGAPTNMVHIARYNMVQEQANDAWVSVSPYAGASIRTLVDTGSPSPSGSFSFTEWSQPAGDAPHFVSHGNNTGPFNFDNCVFSGGKFTSYTAECGVTNSLFVRVNGFVMDQPVTGIENRFYNNSFVGGSWGFYQGGGTELSWQFFNNAFYTTNIDNQHQVAHGHNAYLSSSNRIGSYASNDIIISNFSFQTGPLGYFYLPTNSSLLNTGSMSASSAGLYWFTTTVDQRPETNSLLDLGFHLIALDSTNNGAAPLDTDGDGVANYVEDANGNGVQDIGETSLTRQDSPFLPRDYEPLGPSSRRTPLIISEIMYNPTNQNQEFIELYNTHHLAQDISGFRLEIINGATTFTYTNPPNTILQSQSLLPILFTNRLNNNSGTVRLLNRVGGVLLEVEYEDDFPWPVAADGPGHSLVLVRPSYGENDYRAWAASERIGGSPGYAETNRVDRLRAIVINEFIAAPPAGQDDWIELHNTSNESIDIYGCFLSTSPSNLRRFTNTLAPVIPPRGFVLFNRGTQPGQFNFPLPADGDEKIFLTSPDGTRVVDAIYFRGQSDGVSMGRSPDGAPWFRAMASYTPGAANSGPLEIDVVINEVMFNPVSGDGGEFIELHNRTASPIIVTNWPITGIGYTIPGHYNTTIPSNGFVVVARDTNTLRNAYPNLNSANTVGNYFPARLNNRLEHVVLSRPRASNIWVAMDEVIYRDGGQWGRWTDADGSSLELKDGRSDRRRAANWNDSAAPTANAWVTIQTTGPVQLGDTNAANVIEISLMGAGECLVTNVQVFTNGGANMVLNSTFTTTNNWAMEGNYYLSTITNNYLHLRTDGRGDYVGNRVAGNLSSSIASNTLTTISASVRWLRGSPEILLRLRGNGLELATNVSAPPNLGTPALTNSVAVTNAGPAIFDVSHFPPVPAVGELVLVTARLHDPDGVTNVLLRYRVDPLTTLTNLTMRDDGTGGDALAGDGIWSATLPGRSAGTLVAFRVEATDSLGVTSRFPAEREMYPGDTERRECLVRFGDPQKVSSFGVYRLWMTKATADQWASRSRFQVNDYGLDVTFVYGYERVIYNCAAAFAGSDNTSITHDSPTNILCGYNVSFPKDERFLGVDAALWDWPIKDQTGQREQLAYWMAHELGLPVNYRRFVHLYVNGRDPEQRPNANGYQTARIYEDAQNPDTDYLEQWFPNGSNGDLYKLYVWRQAFPEYSVTNFSSSYSQQHANLLNYTNSTGKNLPSYRWTWRKRAVPAGESAHNYTNLFALVEVFNSSTNYIADIEAIADVEQWTRVFAANRIAGNLDVYQNLNGQNLYAYQPPGGRWNLLPYDLDLVMGETSDSANTSLFTPDCEPPTGPPGTNEIACHVDPRIKELLQNNWFQRAYWRAFQDAVNGPMQTNRYGPVADNNYAVLFNNGVKLANGVTDVQAPASAAGFKTWLDDRRSFISGELNKRACGFAITNNGGNDFTTNASTLLLAGTAPPQVKFLALSSTVTNVTWITVTNWSLSVTLSNGPNSFTVQGYDRLTNALSGTNATMTITRQ